MLFLEALDHQTKFHPEKVALIMGGIKLSYKDLFLEAKKVALEFKRRGLHGERIGFHLPNSPKLLMMYIGCLMAGAIVVPISLTFKEVEIVYIIEKTSPRLVITDAVSFPDIKEVECITSETLEKLSLEKTVDSFKLPSIQNKMPAMIFFTSGSTSRPKGVVHTHGSITAMMETMIDAFDLKEHDRLLVTLSMTFVSGCIQSLLPLLIGATSILMTSFNTPEFLKTIKHHPTRMSLMGRSNYEIIHDPLLTKEHFKGIAFNLAGGDKITEELTLNFKEKTGVPLRIGCGMTEFLILTVNKSTDPKKSQAIGKPAKHAVIQLMKADGAQAKIGEVGEAFVKGPNRILEYYNEPKLTRKALSGDWLRTGDLMRQDEEGDYWFIGRSKLMIIRNSTNISPLEIEDVLAMHPAVKIAGVIGVPHIADGHVPKAFVELKPKHTASVEELKAFVKMHLRDVKVPEYIVIVDHLPVSHTGKIDRALLKDL